MLPCIKQVTTMYKQVFNDFKAIMRDKHERNEFLGGFAFVLAMFAVTYFWLWIAYAVQG